MRIGHLFGILLALVPRWHLWKGISDSAKGTGGLAKATDDLAKALRTSTKALGTSTEVTGSVGHPGSISRLALSVKE